MRNFTLILQSGIHIGPPFTSVLQVILGSVLRPYIDSEINHIRHFIKIQFVNKGIEFINLPSIFKDKSVISSFPTYFENKEYPIICYKYNKPIRSTVLTLTNK